MNYSTLRKPRRLEDGNYIGLVSPSSSLASLVPHRTKRAINALQNLGFKIKVGENALVNTNGVAGSDVSRAKDINNFFEDPEIKAIICLIGGLHYNQLIKFIDFNLVSSNPKIFLGYSDATVLHLAFLKKSNLMTFYGPAGLTQFGDYPSPLQYTVDSFRSTLQDTTIIGDIKPSVEWTDELLDWLQNKDSLRPRCMNRNPGYYWLREGNATGPIIGGCLPSLLHLRGTSFWPEFEGAILMLETPEGHDIFSGYSLERVAMDLADLDLSGVFEKVSGMILGRPYRYDSLQRYYLFELIEKYTAPFSYPILADVDFGHTDPMVTIPIGAEVNINSDRNSWTILTSGVI